VDPQIILFFEFIFAEGKVSTSLVDTESIFIYYEWLKPFKVFAFYISDDPSAFNADAIAISFSIFALLTRHGIV
jgi:hypothetical protein